MQTMHDSYYLAVRALRESIRQPGVELGNIFIPVFFFAVILGAVGSVAEFAFEIDNYVGFQVPVAVLQAVAGVASVSGIVMVTDIQRGYFDKLLLTPASRWSILLGRVLADGVRGTIFTSLVVVVGLVVGSGMATGVAGVIVLLLLAGLFSAAYSGIGLAIAFRTGSAQAAQAGFLIFFPLLFLAPTFAPTDIFEPWLETLAMINPITYLLGGMRSLIIEGWQWEPLVEAFGAVLGMGVVTLGAASMMMRYRLR